MIRHMKYHFLRWILLAAMGFPVLAQPPLASVAPASNLSGDLFYLILQGELQAAQGEFGPAAATLLEAAIKTRDEALYERAFNLAWQSRAGKLTLRTALAWRQAAPNSRSAHASVMQVQINLQELLDVPFSLRKVLSLAPDAERGPMLLSIPSLFKLAADKKVAAQVVEQALFPWIETPEFGAQSWTAIGHMRLLNQDPEGALLAAQRGAAINPKQIESLWLGLEAARYIERARVWMHKVLASQNNTDIHLAWGRLLADLGRFEEAEQVLIKQTLALPTDAAPWLLLGDLRQKMKNPQGANEAWQRVLQHTQGVVERLKEREQALLGLAQLSIDAKQYNQAELWLSQVVDGANARQVLFLRAKMLGLQGQVAAGQQLIANANLKDGSQAPELVMAEIHYLRQFKQWLPAYELLSRWVSTGQVKGDDWYYELAISAEKIGRFQDTESILRAMMARNPDYPQAYNALGYSLANRNERLEEAKTLILKALAFDPDDPFVMDSLGWVEFRLGRHPEALAILQRTFAKRPDPEIAAHLGEVLWTMGQKDQALDIFRQALRLGADSEVLLETLKRLGAKP